MIEYDAVRGAADYLASRISEPPVAGIILGTGLSDALQDMEVESSVPFSDVPNMRPSTNPMHPGRFVLGRLHGKPVIGMLGRIHLYEGYSAWEVAFPVFVMRQLGVQTLVVTNAAGAINTSYEVGQFVVIADHINFQGQNPLHLQLDSRLGIAYPDMTYAYTPALRERVRELALRGGEELVEGVYIGVPGPSFETPAEIRAFRAWGADLVGMSTVPEVIAAASCGMKLFGISLVTNMAAGVLDQKITADDINDISGDVPARLARVIEWAL